MFVQAIEKCVGVGMPRLCGQLASGHFKVCPNDCIDEEMIVPVIIRCGIRFFSDAVVPYARAITSILSFLVSKVDGAVTVMVSAI